MTPLEITERIEKMFEAQFRSRQFQEALGQLQKDLIGEAALRAMRDGRRAELNAYRLAHPSNNRIVSPAAFAKMLLEPQEEQA